ILLIHLLIILIKGPHVFCSLCILYGRDGGFPSSFLVFDVDRWNPNLVNILQTVTYSWWFCQKSIHVEWYSRRLLQPTVLPFSITICASCNLSVLTSIELYWYVLYTFKYSWRRSTVHQITLTLDIS